MNIPHLPPVASAVVTILGVVVAVTRLLTASRPFWDRFPGWVQKGLPATLVALGLLPTALEHATSWLDVAEAIVLAVSAWFTASRGDKRPPVDKDGGPRIDRTNSDPRLDRSELAGTDNERPLALKRWRHPEWRLAVLLVVAVLLCNCSHETQQPICSPQSLAAITAECSAKAFECGKAGIPKEDCEPMNNCRVRLDSRQETCR